MEPDKLGPPPKMLSLYEIIELYKSNRENLPKKIEEKPIEKDGIKKYSIKKVCPIKRDCLSNKSPLSRINPLDSTEDEIEILENGIACRYYEEGGLCSLMQNYRNGLARDIFGDSYSLPCPYVEDVPNKSKIRRPLIKSGNLINILLITGFVLGCIYGCYKMNEDLEKMKNEKFNQYKINQEISQ